MNDLNPSRSVEGYLPPAAGEACARRRGFSLIEILVVVSLLSLIVLVLMTVFNSTQAAFRAGVTQTDVLEGSRAAMDIITSDLKLMSPAGGPTNYYLSPFLYNYNDINFYEALNYNNFYQPLIQSLPGSNQPRTNVLENIFWLSRQNLNGHDSWVGTGYTVIATNSSPLFPLYRFVTNSPASRNPTLLLVAFLSAIQNNAFTNAGWSHLIDGVLDFRVQPFDLNGYAITNISQYNASQYTTYPNTVFLYPPLFQQQFYFLSNAIPGSVEIQMCTLEDAVLRRAESLGPPSVTQSNYLAQQAGRVHVFRQRVILPNVDPSAYP
jgi:prepilin-type N-terminal cleavage/methylation domain-containing protein